MATVTTRWDLVREYGVCVAIVASVPVLAWLALGFGKLGTFAAVGLIGLVAGVYIGLRHPLWLYWALAFILAALPFGYFPGVHLPMYLALAFGVLLAAADPSERANGALPLGDSRGGARRRVRAHPGVRWHLPFRASSSLRRWAAAMSVMIALLRLSPENMAKFGRIYVYTACSERNIRHLHRRRGSRAKVLSSAADLRLRSGRRCGRSPVRLHQRPGRDQPACASAAPGSSRTARA